MSDTPRPGRVAVLEAAPPPSGKIEESFRQLLGIARQLKGLKLSAEVVKPLQAPSFEFPAAADNLMGNDERVRLFLSYLLLNFDALVINNRYESPDQLPNAVGALASAIALGFVAAGGTVAFTSQRQEVSGAWDRVPRGRRTRFKSTAGPAWSRDDAGMTETIMRHPDMVFLDDNLADLPLQGSDTAQPTDGVVVNYVSINDPGDSPSDLFYGLEQPGVYGRDVVIVPDTGEIFIGGQS